MKKKHSEVNTYKKKSNQWFHVRKLLLAAGMGMAVLFVGCQAKEKSANTTNANIMDSNINNTNSDTNAANSNTVDTNTENDQIKDSNTTENGGSIDTNTTAEETLTFSDLARYQFAFSSGAGAWQTILNINEDGTFNGYYSDNDMGDTGEGYPNGTIYLSTFEGKFTTLMRVNDYTYSTTVELIELEKKVGTEEIMDGIRYIYSEPYGLDHAKEIYIYTTQAPLKELPEGFRSWVNNLIDMEKENLPFYGLYNIETESGFSSYPIDFFPDENADVNFIAEVVEIDKQYEEMKYRFQNEDLSQTDMNFLAEELYVLWDNEINKLWKNLKETLEKETMDQLITEQREWIKYKENEIKKAGSVYEGGSIRPMIEYLKGAELTRDRVYELLELLK